jgi:uncharacterized protein YodC (DUF2158 family)
MKLIVETYLMAGMWSCYFFEGEYENIPVGQRSEFRAREL